MSELFKASNGIELDEFGEVGNQDYVTFGELHDARKEFYQTLRDQELGRWRSKKHPEYVVYYRSDVDYIFVVNEVTGQNRLARHGSSIDIETAPKVIREVGLEYLESNTASPLLKAKPGDLWRVTDRKGNTFITTVIKGKSDYIFFITPDGDEFDFYELVDGELVWSFDEL